MHPILFRIPLPPWALPLGLAFAFVFALAAAAAVFAWRRKARDLLALGGALALFAAIAAIATWGRHFRLGPIPVPSYGAMLFASLAIGWHSTRRLGERDGLSRELVANCYFVAAFSGLAGARLLYVVSHPGAFSGPWEVLALRNGRSAGPTPPCRAWPRASCSRASAATCSAATSAGRSRRRRPNG
jgi:phosphatidylglycerol:prolipoprotein diacylglycerol transferase